MSTTQTPKSSDVLTTGTHEKTSEMKPEKEIHKEHSTKHSEKESSQEGGLKSTVKNVVKGVKNLVKETIGNKPSEGETTSKSTRETPEVYMKTGGTSQKSPEENYPHAYVEKEDLRDEHSFEEDTTPEHHLHYVSMKERLSHIHPGGTQEENVEPQPLGNKPATSKTVNPKFTVRESGGEMKSQNVQGIPQEVINDIKKEDVIITDVSESSSKQSGSIPGTSQGMTSNLGKSSSQGMSGLSSNPSSSQGMSSNIGKSSSQGMSGMSSNIGKSSSQGMSGMSSNPSSSQGMSSNPSSSQGMSSNPSSSQGMSSNIGQSSRQG